MTKETLNWLRRLKEYAVNYQNRKTDISLAALLGYISSVDFLIKLLEKDERRSKTTS